MSASRELRHPSELPFYVFMVVLNLLIIGFIVQFALVLPFLPERVQDSGWRTTIRTAVWGLLLLVPALAIIRETQRASVRGTAVQLSPKQYPSLYQTADDFAHQRHELGATGLVLLASGRHTENVVDVDQLVQQGRQLRGFWVWPAQLPKSHPFTVRRLQRLYRLGLLHARVREPEPETTM